MARHRFNGNVSVASSRGQFPVYSDQALTTQVTDLLDEDGSTAITQVTRERDFYGPDGVTVLWGNPSNDDAASPLQFVATDISQPTAGGLPAGGSAGDVLTKNTDADGDVDWTAPSGGSSCTPVHKTSAYTAVNGDAVLADASGGDFTVTLPAPANCAKVTVKNIGATGVVVVAHNGSENLDGATSFALGTQYMSRDFLSDGTDWWVI